MRSPLRIGLPLLVLLSSVATGVAAALHQAPESRSPERPRVFPDTTRTISVFGDQFATGGMTDDMFRFAATHYVGSQKLTRAAARRLRRENPAFLVLHYRLAQALGHSQDNGTCQPSQRDWVQIVHGDDWVREWPGDTVAKEPWFFHRNGARVYNCQFGHYLTDLDNPEWRDWWSRQIIQQLEDNENDGVFADSFSVPSYLGNAWHPELPAVDSAFESDWARRMRSFTDDMRKRMAGRWKWIPNVGALVTTRDPSDFSNADGVMVENFAMWHAGRYFPLDDWQLQMNRVLPLVRMNRIVIAQSYPDASDPDERLFVLGSFLLVKGASTYINMEIGLDLEWFPEYAIDLGAPIDPLPGSIDGLFVPDWGVYLRRYEKGVALVNPGDTPRRITMDRPFLRVTPRGGGLVPRDGRAPGSLETSAASTITLDPHRAAVLLVH